MEGTTRTGHKDLIFGALQDWRAALAGWDFLIFLFLSSFDSGVRQGRKGGLHYTTRHIYTYMIPSCASQSVRLRISIACSRGRMSLLERRVLSMPWISEEIGELEFASILRRAFIALSSADCSSCISNANPSDRDRKVGMRKVDGLDCGRAVMFSFIC